MLDDLPTENKERMFIFRHELDPLVGGNEAGVTIQNGAHSPTFDVLYKCRDSSTSTLVCLQHPLVIFKPPLSIYTLPYSVSGYNDEVIQPVQRFIPVDG